MVMLIQGLPPGASIPAGGPTNAETCPAMLWPEHPASLSHPANLIATAQNQATSTKSAVMTREPQSERSAGRGVQRTYFPSIEATQRPGRRQALRRGSHQQVVSSLRASHKIVWSILVCGYGSRPLVHLIPRAGYEAVFSTTRRKLSPCTIIVNNTTR